MESWYLAQFATLHWKLCIVCKNELLIKNKYSNYDAFIFRIDRPTVRVSDHEALRYFICLFFLLLMFISLFKPFWRFIIYRFESLAITGYHSEWIISDDILSLN